MLGERDELELCVIYQSDTQPSWDVDDDWFAREHPYPARHLRSWQRGRPGRTPIVWPRGLERALSAFEPDVVVASEYSPASLRALAWCRRRGRAFLVFTECTPQINSMIPPAQLSLHRWVARKADGVIAVSSAARNRVLDFGIPDRRVTVALQSADLESIRAQPASHCQTGISVLSVGRLVPDKNFATLIEACAGLEVRLEIAGSGFLEGSLRELGQRSGVAVSWHGHLPPAQLPALYARADIYALVSTYEPFGVSLREAAAAGLPIVCSRVAGAAGDVAVAGRNAILVDPNSAAEIRGAVSRLAADAELRRSMGAESRAIDAETDGRDIDAFAGAVLAASRAKQSR
ncbi:MAG TPA: glycosyltransferase family 4 protein [Solirubrobacteraceae bacterium]|nr:glycosyltransferase family 4 protein [Solirubrobacteraceae bacterium]